MYKRSLLPFTYSTHFVLPSHVKLEFWISPGLQSHWKLPGKFLQSENRSGHLFGSSHSLMSLEQSADVHPLLQTHVPFLLTQYEVLDLSQVHGVVHASSPKVNEGHSERILDQQQI